MTSSNALARWRTLQAVVLLGLWTSAPAQAALGDQEQAIAYDRAQWGMQHAMERRPLAVRKHLLQDASGARVTQFVGPQGSVFAVAWHTGFKPNLELLLGSDSTEVGAAMRREMAYRGVQRQFAHHGRDVVVFSAAYLQRYHGYAYRPSLLPPGFDLRLLQGD